MNVKAEYKPGTLVKVWDNFEDKWCHALLVENYSPGLWEISCLGRTFTVREKLLCPTEQ